MSPATLLFNYLLNALWQIPLVFCAAWLAVRLARRNGPQWEHRIWVGALFFELLLPLGKLNLQPVTEFFLSLLAPAAPSAAASVSVSTGAATTAAPAWQLSPLVITLVLAVYAATVLYFTGRLAWRLHKTSALRRQAHAVASKDYRALHNFLRNYPAPFDFLVSNSVSSPAIIGALRPALLLPPSFLDRTAACDVEAALAHETAHLRRRDYAKNLIYEILTLPLAWHPLAWLTRSRIAESREILCDHLAAHITFGPQDYARALLRLASQQSVRIPQTIHAIGIFDTQSLERRIMQLTQSHNPSSLARRLLTIAACTALAVTTGAFALGLHVDAASAVAHSKQAPVKSVHLSPGVMAGNRISGVDPKYPVEAKKKHVQGTITLAALISKEGKIEHLTVISGPTLLRSSSLKAVRTWRYKPYILNGNPVTVKTEIHIVYSLGNGKPAQH